MNIFFVVSSLLPFSFFLAHVLLISRHNSLPYKASVFHGFKP